jgi:hypothetical protein
MIRGTPLLLLACCLIAATAGCPAGGFEGRYIVLNSGKAAIQNITLSLAGHEKSWAVTEAGQGWIIDNFDGHSKTVDVAWENETGEHRKCTIDFSRAAGYRCTDDLIIEFTIEGVPRWRLARRN